MARKANRDEIVANLNARIRVKQAEREPCHQLQDLLNAICRQQHGCSIAEDTATLDKYLKWLEDGR